MKIINYDTGKVIEELKGSERGNKMDKMKFTCGHEAD